jgi:hypothetical protein
MVRGGQALILEAIKGTAAELSQSKLSRYLSGDQWLRYDVAVALSDIFQGTTADDWMCRRIEKIERAVVKWAAKNCGRPECRKRWGNYRFK